MRAVSLTFDDGLIDSVRQAADLLPWARFGLFLVSGWLDGSEPITDTGNVGLNHGTLTDWQELAAVGHDLACHSYSHPMPSIYNAPTYLADCEKSRQWFSDRISGPLHFAFPYCRAIHVPEGYRSYKSGERTGPYNSLPLDDYPILNAVNPIWDYTNRKFRPFESVFAILDAQPQDSWLILTFHGINEGWGPVTPAEFASLGSYLRSSDHQVRTMTEMLP